MPVFSQCLIKIYWDAFSSYLDQASKIETNIKPKYREVTVGLGLNFSVSFAGQLMPFVPIYRRHFQRLWVLIFQLNFVFLHFALFTAKKLCDVIKSKIVFFIFYRILFFLMTHNTKECLRLSNQRRDI